MKLKDITLSIYDGKHGDCKNKDGSGVYFISVKDLREYEIDYSNARQIDELEFEQNYKRTNLEAGDTIYANTGDTIGKSLYVVDNPLVSKTSFQKSVAVIKPNHTFVDSKYLYYLLKYETPRLRKVATGSGQKNLLLSTMREFEVSIHDRKFQEQMARMLGAIDDKIRVNCKINDNLENQIQTIYDYWFTQFEFPDSNGNPYKLGNGQFKWNAILKRDIPINWSVGSVAKNNLAKFIKPGIDKFEHKTYLATADVKGTVISEGTIISYDNRESRANMQPTEYSVWFAKMKNSIKHLYLNPEMKPIIEGSILSTGFCGLQCDETSFEYISSYIANPYFELHKDMLAHGATQEAVNNDDLAGIHLLIPDKETLKMYHNTTKFLYSQIARNVCENKELIKLRDWLLPMLMNGQATIED